MPNNDVNTDVHFRNDSRPRVGSAGLRLLKSGFWKRKWLFVATASKSVGGIATSEITTFWRKRESGSTGAAEAPLKSTASKTLVESVAISPLPYIDCQRVFSHNIYCDRSHYHYHCSKSLSLWPLTPWFFRKSALLAMIRVFFPLHSFSHFVPDNIAMTKRNYLEQCWTDY